MIIIMARLLCFFTALLCITAEARAQEAFGLAMHGSPKYSAQDTHLSYVNPAAPKGGTLKLAGIGTFDTLNPFSMKGVAAEGLPLIYDRLMQRVWDEPFTLYPLIAQHITVAPDRAWIAFTLNPKARFHDGTKITTDDVAYSFNTLKEFGRPNMRRIYKLVTKVEQQTNQTIKFTLGAGYDRETVMILAMMPVLSKAWWSKHSFDSALTSAPLSNGAYKIKEIDLGRRVTYARVPDYWAKDLLVNAGQYNADTITYDYYRDDSIALEAFKKGDLDVRREWDVSKWETAYGNLDLSKFKRLEIPHHRPERAQGIIFNLRREPFNNIKVRKAFALAFDQDWVGKNLYHQKFQRIQSVFPNSILDGSGKLSPQSLAFLEPYREKLSPDVFKKTLKTNDNRPERERMREASALLKEAGWIVENAKRVHKDTKKPLEFEILLSTPQDEKTALTFQRSLERLGITATLRLQDNATFLMRKNAYDYDMMMFYWQNSLSPGTEQSLYWSCAAAKQQAQFNYAGICNPALDYLSAKIPDAQNYETLTALAQSIDRILLSEYLFIPLFYKGTDYIASRKNIMFPAQNPLYGVVMETLWVEPKIPSSTK